MAERRMFAKTIVLSDEFLDMPPTARCLYFTLGMFADDDGFVNSPKGIMRQCGSSEDDLKILLAKKFLISFESGVIVIKHWRINNYLQKDRYKATVYTEERDLLDLDDKGNYHKKKSDEESMYTQDMYTDCVYTQDSIGKDSIGKDSIDTFSPHGEQVKNDTVQEVIDLYNKICVSLPRARTSSDARKKAIKVRLKLHTQDEIREVFEKTESSDFLSGRKSEWKASLDWLMNETNFCKVLEGNYDNNDKPLKETFYHRTGTERPKESDELYRSLISIPGGENNDD